MDTVKKLKLLVVALLSFNFILLISLISVSSKVNSTSFNQNMEAVITPTIAKLWDFPPTFWSNHYTNTPVNTWNTFVSSGKTLAFKYPDDLTVIQKGNGNIYILPVERIVNGDLNLLGGFYIILSRFTDYEIPLETDLKTVDYSNSLYRFEHFYEDISGVTFYNSTLKTYLTKSQVADLEHGVMYVTYTNDEEKKLARTIIGTIVSGEGFDMNDIPSSEVDIPLFSVENSTLQTSINLGITYNLPKGYTAIEELNLDEKSYILDLSKGDCSISVSDNPEYVGFSTSGALCANSGPDNCRYVGKYLVPYFGNHITIVRDLKSLRINYRGVVYAERNVRLSASITATGKEPACISEMLGVLYSLRDITN